MSDEDFHLVCPEDGSPLLFVQEESSVRGWDVEPEDWNADDLDHITDDPHEAQPFEYDATQYFVCTHEQSIIRGHKYQCLDDLLAELKAKQHGEDCPNHKTLWKAGGIFFSSDGAPRCRICQGAIYTDTEDNDPERVRVRNAIAQLRSDFAEGET